MHESRLGRALRELLQAQRVASLGTVDPSGLPTVSMVPYAVARLSESANGTPQAILVLHISALAAHTGHMQRQPRASLMVMQPEALGEPVHALPRVTLEVLAHTPTPGSSEHAACRQAYLERFPDVEPMTALPDFRFVALHPKSARQVAGFGAARSVDSAELMQTLLRDD
jgi:hypothetical protein